MGDEKRLVELFKVAYAKDRRFTAEEVEETIKLRERNKSSENMQALADGALFHTGEFTWPMTGTVDRTKVGREWCSWNYDWWTLAVYSTIPEMRDYCRSWMYWCYLHRCNPVTIVYRRSQDEKVTRPRNYGLTNWRGEVCQPPCNRTIHNLDQVPYVERHPASRIKHNVDHPVIAWSSDVLRENWRSFYPADGFYIGLRKAQRFRLWVSEEGTEPDPSFIAIMGRSMHNTRGAIPVVRWNARTRVLELISPSRNMGGGQWSKCVSYVEDSNVVTETDPSSEDHNRITIPLPASYSLVSDRRESDTPIYPPPSIPPLPPWESRIEKLLDRIDNDSEMISPQRGSNWKYTQGIRNKTSRIRDLLS